MKLGVPMTAPSCVGPPIGAALPWAGSGSNIFAMPKSTSFTTYGVALIVSPSVAARKMLSGLRSRWTMPALCAFASAFAACPMTSATSAGRERSASDERVGERLALEVLHDDVRKAGFVHAVVEDLYRVLRLELRGRARLDLEALARVGRGGVVRLDELDRDARAERFVDAFPHRSHAA